MGKPKGRTLMGPRRNLVFFCQFNALHEKQRDGVGGGGRGEGGG